MPGAVPNNPTQSEYDNTHIFEEQSNSFVGKCLDNRYDIIKLIASGGMGDVYLARQRGVGLDVAVKKLHDAFYKDPEVVAQFVEEARLYARITHPNAVKLHDLLNVKGQICIIMEYVHGQTLTSFIDSGFIFSIRQILDIGLQLADALGAVHNAGVIHRDLKSQNVMLLKTVGNRFSVKILDFGIALMMDKNKASTTERGLVIGSPQYMSPEQCYGNSLDARSDIYAFGILLFYMICNRLPFDARKPLDLMQLQISAPVPQMKRPDSSEIPAALTTLVHKCLEKDADKRYSSFAEVITDLTCIQEGRPLCIAGKTSIAEEVMAAIAAAEHELTNNAGSHERQFALDAGETTVTLIPNNLGFKLRTLLRAMLSHIQSGFTALQEYCLQSYKFIILAICIAIIIVTLFIAAIAFISRDEIAITQHETESIDFDAVPADNSNENSITDNESLDVWDEPEPALDVISLHENNFTRQCLSQFERSIIERAQRLNQAGQLESARKWLKLLDNVVLPKTDKSRFDKVKKQNKKYAGLIKTAQQYQDSRRCSRIAQILQKIPDDSDGMREIIQDINQNCRPVHKNSNHKSKKHNKTHSDFDWSTIDTE